LKCASTRTDRALASVERSLTAIDFDRAIVKGAITMIHALRTTGMSIACVFTALGTQPVDAQHAPHPSPPAHAMPSHPQAAPAAGPADAKVELENDAVLVVRIRMAPHEMTPMHDIATARLVVWLTGVHLRDTQADGTVSEIRRHAGEFDWVPVQRHAGENLSEQPLEFLAIVPKSGAAAAK
jgi:hypothetical protein